MNHGTAPEGMECACCYDDIVGGKDGNYVEYRTGEGKPWLPSFFCTMCIGMLIKRQWPIYEETLAKATCKAQQKRMLGEGPPTHVHDKKALKCEEGESVHSLWYVGDDGGEPQVQSALLEGAPQGEARQIWWDEKLAFQFDEDDDEEEEKAKDKPADPDTAATASTPPPVPGTASPPPVPPPAAPAAPAVAFPSQQGGEVPDKDARSTEESPAAAAEAAAEVVGDGAVEANVQAAAAPSEMAVEEEASAPLPEPAASAVPLA